MKEITISVKRQWTELKWLALSFVLAFLMNVIAILIYNTPWSELWSQLLWVIALTFPVYLLTALIRCVAAFFKRHTNHKP
jgi:hypothetical protein